MNGSVSLSIYRACNYKSNHMKEGGWGLGGDLTCFEKGGFVLGRDLMVSFPKEGPLVRC